MKAARMSPAGAYPCGNGGSLNSFSPMRTSSSDWSSSCGAACATTLRSQAVDAGSFHRGDERATYSSDRSDRAYDGFLLFAGRVWYVSLRLEEA